jgi:hypothetical protein
MNSDADLDKSTNVGARQKTLMLGVLSAALVAAGLWLAMYGGLPPIAWMDNAWSRLAFAIKCCCVAVLGVFAGVEICLLCINRGTLAG